MAFIHQLVKYPIRTAKTCLIGFMFVGIGLFISVIGPALLDLQALAGVAISQIALLLPARSFGYAIGSIIAGLLGDRIDHQITLMVAIFFAVITSFCFPLFPSITVMYIFISFGGIANGIIDTLGNCWLIHIWGKENPPFMQLIHFMYGLGAFIAPFITEPFLTKHTEDSVFNHSSTTENPMILSNFSTIDPTMLTPQIPVEGLRIHWPFIITAIYNFFVLCAFAVIYFLYPDNTVHPSRIRSADYDDKDEKKDEFYLKVPLEGTLKTMVVLISTLAMHSYVGIEISFGSLLSPFAVKSGLHMTKSEGSFITSTYWGMYTFLRVFSLIAIIYFSPRFLLFVNFCIIMFSNVILFPFANDHRWALWVGSALMGLGCSSVFATVFAFIEQLTPVTAKITGGFLVAACAGEFIIPSIVAAFIEEDPRVFLWVVLIYSLISFVCILFLFYIQWNLLKKQKMKEIKSIELRTKDEFNSLNGIGITNDLSKQDLKLGNEKIQKY